VPASPTVLRIRVANGHQQILSVKIDPAAVKADEVELLEELVLAHARIFPGYERGSKDFDGLDNPLYELGQHIDCWGTVWENVARGLDSFPAVYPLADWSALDDYVPPDPLRDDMFGPRDWGQMRRSLDEAKRLQSGFFRTYPRLRSWQRTQAGRTENRSASSWPVCSWSR